MTNWADVPPMATIEGIPPLPGEGHLAYARRAQQVLMTRLEVAIKPPTLWQRLRRWIGRKA